MVTARAFLGLLFFGLCVLGSGVALSSELPWDPSSPITWEDFRGEPTGDAQWTAGAAAIHVTVQWRASFTIAYDFETDRWHGAIDGETLEVRNLMVPDRSWVLPGKETPEILNHERRHFDLNEAYCRKLRTALLSLTARGGSAEVVREALQAAIDETVDRILAALERAQERYERETSHGNDVAGQEKWDDLISRWLDDPALAPTSL